MCKENIQFVIALKEEKKTYYHKYTKNDINIS